MKLIKALCIVNFFLFLFIKSTNAQSNVGKNQPSSVLYLEAYGNNMAYSLNYESLLRQGNRFNTMYRIGIGGIPNRFGLPIGIHFLKGRGVKYLDLGLGLTYIYGGQVISGQTDVQRGEGIFFTPTIGYRRQLHSSGLFFRINAGLNIKMKEYNPAIGKSNPPPIIGLAFGYSFGKRIEP